MSQKNLPNGWKWGIGEANRPLSEGGYYMKPFTRTLPGSNQYVTRSLGMIVDTADMPPRKHVVQLHKRVHDDDGTISEEIIETVTVDVQDPQSDEEQNNAEVEAWLKACELMEQYPE